MLTNYYRIEGFNQVIHINGKKNVVLTFNIDNIVVGLNI